MVNVHLCFGFASVIGCIDDLKPNVHGGFGVADFSCYNYRWSRYILQVLMCLMLVLQVRI